ncbi:MAG: hypothetical protein EOO45_10520 [Flavobacterium sp.]|nr:MAG: hypothetical protein EOO45_10520 [Flavobacterium sp.]
MKSVLPFLLLALSMFACSNPSQKKLTKNPDFDRGYYQYYYQKWDSAFLYFNRYVEKADDSFSKAKAYTYMAELQWNAGDLYAAEESLMGSIRTLNPSIVSGTY